MEGDYGYKQIIKPTIFDKKVLVEKILLNSKREDVIRDVKFFAPDDVKKAKKKFEE